MEDSISEGSEINEKEFGGDLGKAVSSEDSAENLPKNSWTEATATSNGFGYKNGKYVFGRTFEEATEIGPISIGDEAKKLPALGPNGLEGKTIVICLPGNDYSSMWLMNHFMPFLTKLGEWNAKFRIAQKSGSNVCEVRETILGAEFGKPLTALTKPWNGQIEYDYMLWIDSDVLFTPEHFEALYRWNKDIVCGLYLKNQGGDFAPARMDPEFEAGRANNIWSLNVRDLIGKEGELLEVITASMGFCLVKNNVFEKIQRPWFPSMPVKMPGGDELFCGEDVNFSFRAREAGFKFYIDPTVIIPHYKQSGWMCRVPTQEEFDRNEAYRMAQEKMAKEAQSPNRQAAFGGKHGR